MSDVKSEEPAADVPEESDALEIDTLDEIAGGGSETRDSGWNRVQRPKT